MDKLILPDGSEFTAIAAMTISRSVNDGEDLCLGSACAAMLEATVYGDTPIASVGQELGCVRGSKEEGLFCVQELRRAGPTTWTLTAYDRMIRFDRDVSGWLDALARPLTLQQLLQALCSHCGVEISDTGALPGGDLPVPEFTAAALSGRELLRLIGQAAGRFFTVDAQGKLKSGWYYSIPLVVGQELPYRMDSLRRETYTCAPIERVQIRAGEDDVGTVWPDGADASANTYVIQGNPLLTAGQTADLQAVAKRLWEQLKNYACTPFSCTLMPGSGVQVGHIVTVSAEDGDTFTVPVMNLRFSRSGTVISATGSPSLESTAAFNRLKLDDLRGRVLTVERGVEGLRVENADLSGALASMELNLQGITTRVEAVETDSADHAGRSELSVLEQRADALDLSITQVRQQTEGKADRETVEQITEHFLFDADGLTITNTATGMGIGISQERVIFTGGDDPTTVIRPAQMQTTNLQVQSRLDLGSFSLIPRTNGNLSLRYTA